MHKLAVIGAGMAGLLAGASAVGPAWSQGAPKSCTDAYSTCTKQTSLSKDCETERQWCLKTGTFADPKTKAVSTGLQKK